MWANKDPTATTTAKNRKKRIKKRKKKAGATTLASTATASDSVSTIGNDDDDTSSDGGFGVQNNNNNNNNSEGKSKNNVSNGAGRAKILTPQEIIRNQLIDCDGYEPIRIDVAMGEMWDKGLSYDEYQAVLHYLQQGSGSGSGSSSGIDHIITTHEEEEVGTMTTEEHHGGSSSSSTMPSQQLDNGSVTVSSSDTRDTNNRNNNHDDNVIIISSSNNSNDTSSQIGEDDDAADDEEEEEEEEEVASQQSSQTLTEKQKPPTSMASKLDMVARFENLTDAIFALTQWIKKAATFAEIEELCRAEKTSALPTVVRRGISATEISDPIKFETAVQPGLIGLLGAIFNRCGIIEFEDYDRIEQMLAQAYKKDMGDDDVLRCGPIESDDVLMTLTSQRDKLVLSAKQAGITVRTTMEQFTNAKSDSSDSITTTMVNGNDGGSSSSSLENQDMLLVIVDQETKDRFDKERTHLKELKSRILQGESEKVQELRSSVETIEMERLNVQEKITDLKLTLKKLEAQNENMIFQIETLEGDIEKEQCNDNVQAKQLEKQVRVAKETVKYGNVVGSLASMMVTYGKSLEKATAPKKSSTQQQQQQNLATTTSSVVGDNGSNSDNTNKTNDDLKASTAMEQYLQKVRDYFLSEAKFEPQLRSRILSNRNEIAALKLELLQCAGLGMNTTTGQIEQSIVQKEKVIKMYSKKISTLTEDGRSMYNDLITHLETYESATAAAAVTSGSHKAAVGEVLVKLFPTALLQDVPAVIKALQIPNCDRLDRFVASITEPNSSSAVDSYTNSGDSSTTITEGSAVACAQSLTNIRVSSAVVPAAALPPATPMKFTWASAAKAKINVSAKKQSLLDIQKQELESRNSSS
ncbi:hypothetical protein FRACYDRAFT_248602 [Fragilariopsis cylindrus CCMP1102]|uniref:Uncharacterized protein n=1 Tax=Fragilariopsis cylindrus CCMP1102 TaxID=635003 RepID=A0A1E7ETT9_9STRA|nr:hypothetical protein FRACYDRAFT_248602 [Fragilariopsis cylindrus CCMP1102]|eukprot:OEU09266.1 hypothetical protein FRACYDRAFT_248602 [Fragilariopsis cylindrus CCMP1102]